MGEVLPFRRIPGDPDEPTDPCSNCGQPVDRAAIRCRQCGKSTLPPRYPQRRLPWWMWLGILLAVAVLIGLLGIR